MEDSFNRLLSLICEKNPSQRKFLDASARRLEQGELDFLSSYIEYYLGLGHSLEDLAGAYLTIVEDTQREQMYFGGTAGIATLRSRKLPIQSIMMQTTWESTCTGWP